MTTTQVRIGSRASGLALAQARIAADALATVGVTTAEVIEVTTRGDETSLRRPTGRWVDGDGQFTRELERALLDDHVDVVVHSFKDLPTDVVPGLAIGAVLERADPRDCLLTTDGSHFDDLPFGGRVATSSPRRAAQLAAVRPDLIAVPIRGNVESRVRRLRAGEYDALVLAAAGLDRLGIAVPRRARLPFDVMLPAPAQGALALQVRSGDAALLATMAAVDHRPTRIAVEAERALLRAIGGGCLAPLGALGEVVRDELRLRAVLEDEDGTLRRGDGRGPADDPASVVASVADQLVGVAATR